MDEELKKLYDEIQSAWAEMKKALDKSEQEIKTRGEESAATAEKIAKLEEAISGFETKIADIETKASRLPAPGIEGQDERKTAFFKYCRKGINGLDSDEIKALMVADGFKALTVADDTQSGYLAPTEYVREIIKGEIDYSPIRNYARIRPTSSKSVQIPRKTGALAAQWVSEVGTRSETTGMTYGLEEIPNHELFALVDISHADLEDSAFDIEAELNLEFSEQFGVAEGAGFVSGNGVGKPEGILSKSGMTTVVSGVADNITADQLIDMAYGLKDAYANNAHWMFKRSTMGTIRKLKDGQGNYLWMAGLANNAPPTILDIPYFTAADMPAIAADAYPVVLGDFRRGYLIEDRIEMSVLRDPFTQAATGKVRFLARRRVGGQVILVEAFIKGKCSVA